MQNKINQLNDKIDSRESVVKSLEIENNRLKSLLENKFIEIEILKKDFANKKNKESRNSLSIDYTKKVFEEKASELLQSQKKIREKIHSKSSFKENKRPLDSFNSNVVFSSYKPSQKAHKRSFSDSKAYYND